MTYLYKSNTGKLHIKDFCTHTKGRQTNYLVFKSEDDAIAYDGRAVSMCKLCQRKKEQTLKEKVKKIS